MRDRQLGSTAHPITFLLVLSSDHITGATGKVPTVTISKDGGAFAAPAGAVSEIGNGWYALAANSTDRNTLGDFALHATAAGCDPLDREYAIVAYDPFNAANLGLTGLPAIDGSNRVLLQPTQTGVTIPTVTNTGQINGQTPPLHWGTLSIDSVDGGVKVHSYATGQDPVTLVWTNTSAFTSPVTGSAAAKLNAAGAAGDPLAIDLATASYTGTQAGAILKELDLNAALTARDQTTNTTPNGHDARLAAWTAAFGVEGDPNSDGTIPVLSPDRSTTIFTYGAPLPVQIASNGLDNACDATGNTPADYLRLAAAVAAGDVSGVGPFGVPSTVTTWAAKGPNTTDPKPIVTAECDGVGNRTISGVTP